MRERKCSNQQHTLTSKTFLKWSEEVTDLEAAITASICCEEVNVWLWFCKARTNYPKWPKSYSPKTATVVVRQQRTRTTVTCMNSQELEGQCPPQSYPWRSSHSVVLVTSRLYVTAQWGQYDNNYVHVCIAIHVCTHAMYAKLPMTITYTYTHGINYDDLFLKMRNSGPILILDLSIQINVPFERAPSTCKLSENHNNRCIEHSI